MKVIIEVDNDSILAIATLCGSKCHKEEVKRFISENDSIEIDTKMFGKDEEEAVKSLNFLTASLVIGQIETSYHENN